LPSTPGNEKSGAASPISSRYKPAMAAADGTAPGGFGVCPEWPHITVAHRIITGSEVFFIKCLTPLAQPSLRSRIVDPRHPRDTPSPVTLPMG
jgi:hypothetical protein